MSNENQPLILVVDDQPINIKLLQRRLEREGMEVITAFNGVECLEVVDKQIPDLILLDVMMPEMDGIEACRRLKENVETCEIPVIFITARTSQEGKIEGLKTGGVDYITKPIDLDETLARVKTQLKIQQTHRENMQLQQRLSDIRRSAAIGSITQGISHNLNNLLGVVVGYIDLLKYSGDKPELAEKSINAMDRAIQRMVKLIRELSRIASEEKVPKTDCVLKEVLQNTVNRFQNEYSREEEITVNNSLAEDFSFDTNPEVFESLIGKTLINAVEACENTDRDTEVSIDIDLKKKSNNEFLIVKVKDNGCGVDPAFVDTLFEPFVSTQTAVGRGLGLTMARHAVKTLEGEIIIDSEEGQGTVATITLPCKPLGDDDVIIMRNLNPAEEES